MPALDKAKLRRELERERRTRIDARLRELRALIKEARAARRAAVKAIGEQCKAARKKLTTVCERRRARARSEGAATIDARRRAYEGEKRDERSLRDADRRAFGAKPGVRRATRAERRQESDDEVRANIPDSLRAVFEHVRRHVKGNARMSRTEAFLHWAEENPGEVYAYQAEQAERDLARMIAEHERAAKLSRRARGRGGRAALAEVPF